MCVVKGQSELESSEDHVLPYMTDPRHAPDTLFFVAEKDWRLFRSEAQQWLSVSPPRNDQEELPAGGETAGPDPKESEAEIVDPSKVDMVFEERFKTQEPSSSSSAPPPATVDPPVEYPGYTHLGDRWYMRTKEPKTDKFVVSQSPHIEDMVKMMTAAHRAGFGELVWMAYEAARRGDTWNCDDRPN